MRTMKIWNRALLTSLAMLTALLLTACGHAQTEGAASGEPQILWTETDQWPDNGFTQQVPRPRAGVVHATAQGQSQGYDFFAVLQMCIRDRPSFSRR